MEVHSSTTLPSASRIWIVAPSISSPLAMSVLETLTFVLASSTRRMPSSVMLPVVVTFPFSSIVKVVSVATAYPSGATVSLSVYSVPVFRPSIRCASFVEVHSSTTLPSLSRIWIVAPSSSSPSAMSTLDTLTLVLASSTRMTPSSVIVPVVVTLPVSSIVKVVSVAIVYPSGATVSLSVYSMPVFNPSIRCASFVEVHSSTTFPSASMTWIVAPSTSLPSAMSVLDTLTCVFLSFINRTFSLTVASVLILPYWSTENEISVVTVYPFGAASSCNLYCLPAVIPVIVCVSVEETHSSTTLFFSSKTLIVAPSISSSLVISTFEIFTESNSSSINITPSSVTVPSEFTLFPSSIVNFVSLAIL